MNITELDQFNLSDTVKFHNRLNPRLWDDSERLHPEVRQAMLAIAQDFAEFLGVNNLEITDVTISGSNAAYNYTPKSDIDLHLVVDLPEMNQEVYRELFNAKKYQYNDQHNITIGDADVELYVQPADEPHVSQGIYSVKNNQWISVPRRRAAKIDDASVQHKYQDLAARINQAIAVGNENQLSRITKKLKAMRATGLEQHGEFGIENLVYKMLRDRGVIQRLYDAKLKAHSERLSIEEQTPAPVQYGLGEDAYATPDGVAPTTCMFLNERPADDSQYTEFFQHVIKRLGIETAPKFIMHDNPDWSKRTKSFGVYDPDSHSLEISIVGRHDMDIFRTIAHELVHARQNELGKLKTGSGNTGSKEENQANALAGEIMRGVGRRNPDLFDTGLQEATAKPPKEYRPPPPAAKRQQFTQEYLDNLAQTYSKQHGVPLDMVRHVMNKETGWMPDPSARPYAVSPKYATGLMQIMPQYHQQYGITDPYDPEQSMRAGTKILRQHLDTFKDPKLALAAYNAGPTAVRKHGGVPPFPETQRYVSDYQPQPRDVKPMSEPKDPGVLDTIAAKGREWAGAAVDAINRVTAPPQQFKGAFGVPADTVKEARPVPQPEPDLPYDPDITPLRDRVRQGENPERIARDVARSMATVAGEEIQRREELRQKLEQEKAELERRMREMKTAPPAEQRAWYYTVIDVINRLTAPPKPFPNAFGGSAQPQKEDTEVPAADTEPPSIQRGLNFIRSLSGLSKITAAGAEEELRGAVRDTVQGAGREAIKKILRPNPPQDPVKESSGYIPTEKEKNDPRFKMALTVDIKPGETGRQANRMALQTDSQGRPALLRASGKK